MTEAAAVMAAASFAEEPSVAPVLEGTTRRDGPFAAGSPQQIRRRAPSSCLIPAVDPQAVQDLAALAVQVAAQVDELLRDMHGRLQAATALSVGCIQTYRDGVESLGEAADTSIRSMYTLMARCEELDRELKPVPDLARRIRDLKRLLERLEGLCK
ncbi:BLOC-1-related complex subunit 6 [Sphaerodactylus townsendi]|uniref:BLOC-1-related complex subunit 6 n=1 Tax=Sphaerodactylus townsendi TaxID=933632 RepID=UPI00202750E0|nr:BLOC-1-related complex subunit 6 [Sphaerodactylus townsendi]